MRNGDGEAMKVLCAVGLAGAGNGQWGGAGGKWHVDGNTQEGGNGNGSRGNNLIAALPANDSQCNRLFNIKVSVLTNNSESNHDSYPMGMKQNSKKKQAPSTDPTHLAILVGVPDDSNVLLGSDSILSLHPGNQNLKQLVTNNYITYKKLNRYNRPAKQVIASVIFNRFIATAPYMEPIFVIRKTVKNNRILPY